VPRKTKTAENKNQAFSEPVAPATPTKKTGKRQSRRRATTTKKPRKATPAKETITGTTAQISASPQAEPAASRNLSEDVIRLRAYFISERRRRFALSGDAESDWLEAKRQLLAEERR
jgi:hypothetical protein